MNRDKKWVLATMAALGAALIAERAFEHTAAERLRRVTDPENDPLLVLPEPVIRHDVATHDGGSVHVVEHGTGARPLVLIHGVTLQAEVWAPMMHLLGNHFRVLALDVRGHGASVVGEQGVGRHHAARDLKAVLEHFDVHGAIVVGHSMGGMILGEFCGAYGNVLRDRVAGLVFMNTAVSELIVPSLSKPVLAVAGRMRNRAESGKRMPRTVGDDDRSYVMSRVAFGAHPSGAAIEQVRRLGAAVDQRHYVPLWVDLLDYDGEAALDTVDLPSLVLVGSRDLLTPVPAAKRIVEHLSNGDLHVFPGAGHQLMQERPREVAELILGLADRLDHTAPARSEAVAGASTNP